MRATDKLKSFLYPIPPELLKNHRHGDLEVVSRSVQTHYHRGWRIYKALLRRIYPGLHPGWFDPGLDLVIQK